MTNARAQGHSPAPSPKTTHEGERGLKLASQLLNRGEEKSPCTVRHTVPHSNYKQGGARAGSSVTRPRKVVFKSPLKLKLNFRHPLRSRKSTLRQQKKKKKKKSLRIKTKANI